MTLPIPVASEESLDGNTDPTTIRTTTILIQIMMIVRIQTGWIRTTTVPIQTMQMMEIRIQTTIRIHLVPIQTMDDGNTDPNYDPNYDGTDPNRADDGNMDPNYDPNHDGTDPNYADDGNTDSNYDPNYDGTDPNASKPRRYRSKPCRYGSTDPNYDPNNELTDDRDDHPDPDGYFGGEIYLVAELMIITTCIRSPFAATETLLAEVNSFG